VTISTGHPVFELLRGGRVELPLASACGNISQHVPLPLLVPQSVWACLVILLYFTHWVRCSVLEFMQHMYNLSFIATLWIINTL